MVSANSVNCVHCGQTDCNTSLPRAGEVKKPVSTIGHARNPHVLQTSLAQNCTCITCTCSCTILCLCGMQDLCSASLALFLASVIADVVASCMFYRIVAIWVLRRTFHFFPSGGRHRRQYSLRLLAAGWPG